ncbi:MAG TPA: HAD family hydrolase [Dongiaceae bacterium]|nr:HAD family hydrolase [Dongiaceae bacterium]
MRLLVLTGRGPAGRFARAAAALALRGHRLHRWGPGPAGLPDPVPPIPPWRIGGIGAVDLVLADDVTPVRAVLAGALSGAAGIVMPLVPGAVARWGAIGRACWHGARGAGLVEPADAGVLASRYADLASGAGLWPDGPPSVGIEVAHPDTEILERACERALARTRGPVRRPALFLDRDGTLVREIGYLSSPDEIELLPGVVGALRTAREAGLPVIVISNQSGVGRGWFTLERVYATMARLRERLRAGGVELDAIYFCPHRPEDGCRCRKPNPGLLERAAEDQGLSLKDSVMVGDKRIDAETGQRAGGYGVLVRTGYGGDEEPEPSGDPARPPDAVCEDLADAVEWVIRHTQAG